MLNQNRLTQLQDTLGVVILYLTHKCNLTCSYCLNHFNGSNNGIDLDDNEDYVNRTFNFLDSLTHKTKYISFFGGEPTVKWDVCKALYNRGIQSTDFDYRFNIQTNGVLLNDYIEDIVAMDKLNICISMDANRETHDTYRVFKDGSGSYDIIKNNIALLLDRGLGDRLSVAITYYPSKAANLPKWIQDVYDLGVKTVRTTVIKEEHTDVEGIEIVRKAYTKIADYIAANPDKAYQNFNRFPYNHPNFKFDHKLYLEGQWTNACRAGSHKVFINTNGDIYPCSTMMSSQYQLGNMFDMQFNTKLHSSINNFYDKKCWNCKSRAGCQMCIYRSSLENGTLYCCSDFMQHYCQMKVEVLDYFYKEVLR